MDRQIYLWNWINFIHPLSVPAPYSKHSLKASNRDRRPSRQTMKHDIRTAKLRLDTITLSTDTRGIVCPAGA